MDALKAVLLEIFGNVEPEPEPEMDVDGMRDAAFLAAQEGGEDLVSDDTGVYLRDPVGLDDDVMEPLEPLTYGAGDPREQGVDVDLCRLQLLWG